MLDLRDTDFACSARAGGIVPSSYSVSCPARFGRDTSTIMFREQCAEPAKGR